MTDPVHHPPHYTAHASGIECIQITEHLSFCVGNAVKYLWRAGLKDAPVEDLRKALWYLRRAQPGERVPDVVPSLVSVVIASEPDGLLAGALCELLARTEITRSGLDEAIALVEEAIYHAAPSPDPTGGAMPALLKAVTGQEWTAVEWVEPPTPGTSDDDDWSDVP